MVERNSQDGQEEDYGPEYLARLKAEASKRRKLGIASSGLVAAVAGIVLYAWLHQDGSAPSKLVLATGTGSATPTSLVATETPRPSVTKLATVSPTLSPTPSLTPSPTSSPTVAKPSVVPTSPDPCLTKLGEGWQIESPKGQVCSGETQHHQTCDGSCYFDKAGWEASSLTFLISANQTVTCADGSSQVIADQEEAWGVCTENLYAARTGAPVTAKAAECLRASQIAPTLAQKGLKPGGVVGGQCSREGEKDVRLRIVPK